MENIDPGSMVHPASAIGRGSRASRTELNHELATLLRSSRQQLHNVQHGLNRVMTFEPLTSVKDLIVGDGPAADEIFQYCEDQTVRGYRFRGVFHERPITGPLASRQLGGIEAAKAFAVQNRIDILYCALPRA